MKASPIAATRLVALKRSGWSVTARRVAGSRTELRHPLYSGAAYVGIRGAIRVGRTFGRSRPIAGKMLAALIL